ncbi:MAG TPA: response regulator [Pyrinomonadaceae bacterium]
MRIKAIIVDDVESARERIRLLLNDPEIEIVAECENGREAIEAIRRTKVDLVFLDVQMPQISGFDVIDAVGIDKLPTVVFVTAYDEFALRAFDANAIDYLLKPFDEERFSRALVRAKREIGSRQIPSGIEDRLRNLLEEVRTKPHYLKRIPVKSSRGTTFVSTDEIEWICSSGNDLEIHVGRATYLIRQKLSYLETRLDPEVFMRVHRSTIVNLNCIKSLHPLFNNDHLIILKDGRELNLSRTYYEKLMIRITT